MMKKLCIIDANQKENISFAPGEFGNRCRTCFRNNGMINIFSTKYQDVFLNQMFPMFSFPTITVNDGLPQKVCGACAKILFEFYTFKEKVVQLQPLLNVAAKHLNVVKPVNVTKPGQNFKAQDSGILYNILNENDAGGTAVRKQQDPLSVLCETIKIDDEDDDDSFGGNEEEVENIVICNEDDEDIIENDNEGAEGEVVYEEDYVVQDEEMEETYIKEEEIQISDEILEEQMASEEEVVKEEDEKKDVPKVLYCNPTVFKTIAHHIQTQNQDETLHSFQSDSNEVVNEIVVHGNVIPIPDQLKTALESTEFPRIDHRRRKRLGNNTTTEDTVELQKSTRKCDTKETKPNRPRERCTICKKQVDKKNIERHALLHERDKCKKSIMLFDPETGEYSCNICGEKFKTELEYLLHGKYRKNRIVDRSSDKKPDPKVEEFMRKQNERLRKKSIQPRKKTPCHICGKSYQIQVLRDHVNSHINNRPHSCDVCGKKFVYKSGLRVHYKLHTNNTTNLCETCGKTFRARSRLLAHVRLEHLGIVRYSCKFCGKGFHFSNQLRLHLRKHTGEKPYLCSICGRGFSLMAHMVTHTKEAHTNERPFECKICFKTFAVKYKLNVHVKFCHNKEKKNPTSRRCQTCNEFCRDIIFDEHMRLHGEGHDYICGLCSRTFSDKESFGEHKENKACRKARPVCDVCNKRCHSRAALVIHKRSHSGEKPYVCDICGKNFTTKGHLTAHLKFHTGVKDFDCPYCPKKFSFNGNLKQHIMTHTGEMPHKCALCDKAYAFASRLRRHQIAIHGH